MTETLLHRVCCKGVCLFTTAGLYSRFYGRTAKCRVPVSTLSVLQLCRIVKFRRCDFTLVLYDGKLIHGDAGLGRWRAAAVRLTCADLVVCW